MASMMGGDFVEAYVLRNAYKEKVRRMEEAAAARSSSGAGAGAAGSAAPGGEKTEDAGSGSGGGGRRGGMFPFGLMMKKKVHPGAGSAVATSSTSSGA